MNENQTLEMQIKAKSDEALQSLNKLITKLTGIEKTINSVDKTVNKGTVKNVTTHINQLKNSTDTATNSVNKLNKALSFSGAYLGVKKLTASFLEWMDLAVDRTEQMNLFNVVFKNIEKDGVQTFSTLGKEATKFQYKLNEAFGTNMTETLKYQGLFQSMGENVGIPDTYSALMSETMTKLTYDLASLYNKSESTTGEALRAGVYAGQTKPLRAFGIDVTQTSMQPILDKLGITDRSVKQMTQAEKEILRYIATLEQAQVAMGDFANTIDSPANQLKIFKQQLVEAKVALTSLFIGSFAKILPYANAILMVIKEISKAIADMFGIELKDYNTGIASSEDAYIDLEDSIEGATDAVKELKRQTLGFDQINNINENTNSGSESSSIGGIDQRLLDAINGYDNGMDKVKMKATEIRDKWMEILGFTKHVNEETGETYFTLDDTNSTLYKIISATKDIVKYGKEVISNVFRIIKEDFDNGIFGDAIVFVFERIRDTLKFISEHTMAQQILAKTLEIVIGIKMALLVIKGLGIATGVKSLIDAFGGLNSVTSKVIGAKGVAGAGASGLYGIYGLLLLLATTWTITLVSEGTKSVSDSIKSTTNAIADLTGNSSDASKKLVELAKSGDTSSDAFNNLSNYLLNNIERNKQEIETLESMKNWFTDLTGATKTYTTQQQTLNQTNENTLSLMKSLYDEGYITKEMYNKFSSAVSVSSDNVSNFNEKIQEGKSKLYDFSSEIENTKNKNTKFNNELLSINENVSVLTGVLGISITEVSKFGQELSNTQSSITNSKDKMKELQNIINNTTSKNITIDVDADTNKFSTKLSNAITNGLKSFEAFGSIVGGTLKKDGGIYMGGHWRDIKQYANGGTPLGGEIFIAREAGPELVGKIGNNTAVMNNMQIVDSVKAGVYEAVIMAMSQSSGQTSQIDVHIHTDEGTVVDRINQKTKQTGVCPIEIPVY